MLEWDSKYIDIDNLLLSSFNIEHLPESFGNLKIEGDLDLSDNALETLAKKFGNINSILDLSKMNFEHYQKNLEILK